MILLYKKVDVIVIYRSNLSSQRRSNPGLPMNIKICGCGPEPYSGQIQSCSEGSSTTTTCQLYPVGPQWVQVQKQQWVKSLGPKSEDKEDPPIYALCMETVARKENVYVQLHRNASGKEIILLILSIVPPVLRSEPH